MNLKETEAYNSEEVIQVTDALKAVNMWLNSGDVEITGDNGEVRTGYRISSKPGALLKRMLPYIANPQAK